MLGVKNGLSTSLKRDYPSIILWRCLNHRLELAVSDTIDEVDGFHPLQILLNKIYSIYSTSPKLQRELNEISQELETSVKKIGQVFSVCWVASSYRALKALWNNHQVLYIHFKQASENLALKKLDRQQFKGLADKLST